jgi:hypothetical protein
MHVVKISDPRDRSNFNPRAVTETIIEAVHYAMIHAKYLTFSLCQFRIEDC